MEEGHSESHHDGITNPADLGGIRKTLLWDDGVCLAEWESKRGGEFGLEHEPYSDLQLALVISACITT